MANRIVVYGRAGEPRTERICRELRSMSLTFDFRDVGDSAASLVPTAWPRVEIGSDEPEAGIVAIDDPDMETLRRMLYAQEVLGVTSYWV